MGSKQGEDGGGPGPVWDRRTVIKAGLTGIAATGLELVAAALPDLAIAQPLSKEDIESGQAWLLRELVDTPVYESSEKSAEGKPLLYNPKGTDQIGFKVRFQDADKTDMIVRCNPKECRRSILPLDLSQVNPEDARILTDIDKNGEFLPLVHMSSPDPKEKKVWMMVSARNVDGKLALLRLRPEEVFYTPVHPDREKSLRKRR